MSALIHAIILLSPIEYHSEMRLIIDLNIKMMQGGTHAWEMLAIYIEPDEDGGKILCMYFEIRIEF